MFSTSRNKGGNLTGESVKAVFEVGDFGDATAAFNEPFPRFSDTCDWGLEGLLNG
jgi:hypothetical protein